LGKRDRQGFTANHAKRMTKLMVVGVCIFLLFMLVVQVVLSLARSPVDPTFYRFYPIMAVLGATFGFVMWWGQEQGEYNPFHDR
jgi:cyanate lyase